MSELLRIKQGLAKILPKKPDNQIILDALWLVERIEVLEREKAKAEKQQIPLVEIAIEQLLCYDCPIGSVDRYTTTEAVTKHCQCKGTDYDEDTCPDSVECWKILIAANEVEDRGQVT